MSSHKARGLQRKPPAAAAVAADAITAQCNPKRRHGRWHLHGSCCPHALLMSNALLAHLRFCLPGQCSSTMGMVRTGVEISPSLSLVESPFTSHVDVGARYKSIDAASKTPTHPRLPLTHPYRYVQAQCSHPPVHPSIHPSIHPSTHTQQPSPPRILNIDVSGTISALRAAPVSDPTDHPTPSQAFARALHSLP